MGNILSCCWKRSASPSASPNASPNASPSPVLHSVLVNQVVDELNVCVPSTRISVAVPPTIAALEYGDLDDLDFDVGQPVWRMSDIKMPTETDLELIPSDNPRASTIFLKKSQKDVQGKNMKNNSHHVPPGLCGKHSSCSTIFLDESTISEPNVRITVHCLVFAIYYHIKNRDANRTKDIFEEHLHPFIGETDPKEYFHRCPDLGSIYNFIRPFFTAYQLTGEFAVATLIYIERLVMYAKIDICPTNWKRVVLGAILLAFKYLYDLLIWNVHFCRIMKSITLKDLCLQISFVKSTAHAQPSF
ncbi:cyclin-Y-like protein 1 [Molossus nigricans]